jgi:Tfp pilus assembly protein FimV
MPSRPWARHQPRDSRHHRWPANSDRDDPRNPPTGIAPALDDLDALLEGIEETTSDETVREQTREARQLLAVIWVAHTDTR